MCNCYSRITNRFFQALHLGFELRNVKFTVFLLVNKCSTFSSFAFLVKDASFSISVRTILVATVLTFGKELDGVGQVDNRPSTD